MKRLSLTAAVFTLAGVTLAGCSYPITYQYKMVFEVETPEGVKTAFNVVEVLIPSSGPTKARGEALYLDLGSGRRPLIALLTSHHNNKGYMVGNWGDNSPFKILAKLYGEKFTDYGHTYPLSSGQLCLI